MRRLLIVSLTVLTACSKEQPAPRDLPAPTPSTASSSTAATSTTQPAQQPAEHGDYAKAMDWLKTAERFRFVLTENGVRNEGEMLRTRRGAEIVQFGELVAQPKPSGLAWTRGGQPTKAPDWGPTAYQRITLAVDPQKDEGEARLVAVESDLAHYRFTNAANGDVHDVWVTKESHVARMKIAGKRTAVDLEIR